MAADVCTTCISSLPPYTAQKRQFFEFSFDILPIHNDEMSYVKHVLDPLYVFFTLFGCLERGVAGGFPRGLGHNLLMQLSTLCS